jgi:hypothetical protein
MKPVMPGSIAALQALLPQLSSETFDPEVFRRTGVFVVRNAVAPDVVDAWVSEWKAFHAAIMEKGRDVNRANPVSLNEQLPEGLAQMYREPVFANTLKPLMGEHIALYNHRFVIKDTLSSNKVFLHQDSCYHAGNLNKCSVFVAVSPVNKDNGGMTFHVGSHRLGVLGDAGEINPASFDVQWPTVTPELAPGDFVVMNSHLWHESGPNVSGIDRVMADMIIQPADDPTGQELICGEWQTDIFYSPKNITRHFVNSRILKIVRYEKELTQLKAEAAQASGGTNITVERT